MYLGVARKCFLLLCIIFMMCPKRTTLESVTKSHIKKRIKLNVKDDQTINYGNLEVAEPGFEFTEEEMVKHKIWPGGMIPYYIDDFSFDKVLRDKIRGFLDGVNSMTGVHFSELPRPPDDKETRYIFFINRIGRLDCADLFYKNLTTQGVQKVLIGYDCMSPGDLSAIILALVGVPPQHNAPDRDNYMDIYKDNILPDKIQFFEALADTDWLFHDVAYDFYSAGHYVIHKYTKNGQPTLRPKQIADNRIGEATSFSYSDVWKIRMLYNYITKCSDTKGKEPACSKLFHPGSSFNKFEPESEEEKKSRPKPNKYLGLPEDNPQGPNDNPQGPKDNPQGPNDNPQGPNDNPQGPDDNPQGTNDNPQGPNNNPQGPNDKQDNSVDIKDIDTKNTTSQEKQKDDNKSAVTNTLSEENDQSSDQKSKKGESNSMMISDVSPINVSKSKVMKSKANIMSIDAQFSEESQLAALSDFKTD